MTETPQVNRQQRLSECEAVIERAQRHVEEAGRALMEIRNEAYYVDAGFDNFESYCLAKWNYQKSYISKLISSYQAIQIIESTTESFPNGNKTEELKQIYDIPPSTREEREARPRKTYSEGQLRPLAKIVNNDSIPAEKKEEIIKNIWKESEEAAKAEGKPVPTGEIVQKAAEKHCPEIITENPHPYRVVTYLNAKFRKLLDDRLGKRAEMKFCEQVEVTEKEADVVRRMVEYCLTNNIKV